MRVGPDRPLECGHPIAEDILVVLKLARDSHRYPEDLGFEPGIQVIWRLWRGERTPLDLRWLDFTQRPL